MQKKIIKNKKGFALIFTLMIVSIISAISAGLLNASYKQMILSSLARDSEIAFYQADTASDCALYSDFKVIPAQFTIDNTWTCGGYDLKVEPIPDGYGSYKLLPFDTLSQSNDPCFNIIVKRTPTVTDPNIYATKITAKGYNVCNQSNPRIVEREIVINY